MHPVPQLRHLTILTLAVLLGGCPTDSDSGPDHPNDGTSDSGDEGLNEDFDDAITDVIAEDVANDRDRTADEGRPDSSTLDPILDPVVDVVDDPAVDLVDDPAIDPAADPAFDADPDLAPDRSDPPDFGQPGDPTVGLDFPGSAAVSTTMRFRFFSPLDIYPATYIWRAYPRQQSGYYTAFFWGNDDGAGDLSTFLWDGPPHPGNSFYGAHPYPDPPPNGTDHLWEIAVQQNDYLGGQVVYDRWHTQALIVWEDETGRKHHEFYWDLPNTDSAHRVTRVSPATYGNENPPVPALTWGDAPWAPGNEVWNGILSGIQIYSTNLSLEDVLAEVDEPLSTDAGSASAWYINLQPRPDDIADDSGRGHHPQWVGSERPALWTAE